MCGAHVAPAIVTHIAYYIFRGVFHQNGYVSTTVHNTENGLCMLEMPHGAVRMLVGVCVCVYDRARAWS